MLILSASRYLLILLWLPTAAAVTVSYGRLAADGLAWTPAACDTGALAFATDPRAIAQVNATIAFAPPVPASAYIYGITLALARRCMPAGIIVRDVEVLLSNKTRPVSNNMGRPVGWPTGNVSMISTYGGPQNTWGVATGAGLAGAVLRLSASATSPGSCSLAVDCRALAVEWDTVPPPATTSATTVSTSATTVPTSVDTMSTASTASTASVASTTTTGRTANITTAASIVSTAAPSQPASGTSQRSISIHSITTGANSTARTTWAVIVLTPQSPAPSVPTSAIAPTTARTESERVSSRVPASLVTAILIGVLTTTVLSVLIALAVFCYRRRSKSQRSDKAPSREEIALRRMSESIKTDSVAPSARVSTHASACASVHAVSADYGTLPVHEATQGYDTIPRQEYAGLEEGAAHACMQSTDYVSLPTQARAAPVQYESMPPQPAH